MDNFKFYTLTRSKLGISAASCHAELTEVYGVAAPSRSTIFRWYNEFREDESQAGASAGPSAGRPRTTRTPEMLRAVQQMVEVDCKITVRELAEHLTLGKSTVHEILVQDLQMRNVSSVWVPRVLSEDNKRTRVNCAKHIRRLFFREGMESFCNKLAVQDETWVYFEARPTKQQNRCWLTED